MTPAPDPPYPRLVDERFGPVLRLVRLATPAAMPAAYVAVRADVAGPVRRGPVVDPHAFGTALHDVDAASRAAVGEAVERYCGNVIPTDLRRASYDELCAAGEPALDPSALALYSEEQYAAPGFPFVPFSRRLPVRWVRGRNLVTREATWVPASLVYLNFYAGVFAEEPPTNFQSYAGIAAGETREDAEQAALLEVIERDAVTVWWQSGAPAMAIDIDECPALMADLGPRDRSHASIRYHPIAFPNRFNLPVAGVLLEDRDRGIFVLGTACRVDPVAALRKALCEAVFLHGFSLDLLDPAGRLWRARAAGRLDPRLLQPFRADRAYLDSFRADFRDVIDLGAHAQFYLDPRARRFVERLLAPARHGAIHAGTVGPRDGAPLEALAREGFRAYTVAITTRDIALAGLHVVRVIVPGLYGNAPAAFPYLGGRRLYEEPVRLGWREHPLRPSDLVLAPIPHT